MERHFGVDALNCVTEGVSTVFHNVYSEYAVLRLIGVSGLSLYKTAANAAVKINSYPTEQPKWVYLWIRIWGLKLNYFGKSGLFFKTFDEDRLKKYN